MKILTQDEIEAHRPHTFKGGIERCPCRICNSAIIFKVLPRRYPKFKPSTLTWSIKTALWITPPRS
nr:CMF_HP1_G0048280.mRNA.1.CDS.1 [Saccharomyces cerevisiae]